MGWRHVLKYDHENGEALAKPVFWCGADDNGMEFYFMDAQHVALSAGGSIAPCKKCVNAIINKLQKIYTKE